MLVQPSRNLCRWCPGAALTNGPCTLWILEGIPGQPPAPFICLKTPPTKPLTTWPASDAPHSQPGEPYPSTMPHSGPQLSTAESTDASPLKHNRGRFGSETFQGPLSYSPDVLLSAVEPFTAQVGCEYSVCCTARSLTVLHVL